MGYSLRTTAKVNYRLSEYGEVYWEESHSDKPCRSMGYSNQHRASRDSDERLGRIGCTSDVRGGLQMNERCTPRVHVFFPPGERLSRDQGRVRCTFYFYSPLL